MSPRGTWTRVRRAERLRWPKPVAVGGPRIDLLKHLPSRLPELGVLQVRSAQVVGLHGWVVVDGQVQHGHSWFGSAFAAEVGDQWPPDLKTVHLPGVTLSLVSEWASINYGHLMFDSIPRLDLFERSGFALDDIDHFLCPAPIRDIPRWTELGLDPSRVVLADPKAIYDAETLLAPSFPGARFVLAEWAANFLRDRLSVAANGSHRRLYIPRNTTRRITNEAEVRAILDANGFECLDPAAADGDIRAAFAAADIVVSAHGAVFADMVFCPRTTVVFELIPTDHVYPFFFAAAAACGVRHRYLAGRSDGPRPTSDLRASTYDFHVDTGELSRAVQELTGP